jgi:hypothetical protein
VKPTCVGKLSNVTHPFKMACCTVGHWAKYGARRSRGLALLLGLGEA